MKHTQLVAGLALAAMAAGFKSPVRYAPKPSGATPRVASESGDPTKPVKP